MALLTLTNVSLAFGHLPLFSSADLRIDPAERIAIIGRNGSGKSSLLRLIAGEIPPDEGTVWREPGLRVSRLAQDVPGEGNLSVFDEIAAGLGELGALVSRYHDAVVRLSASGATRDLDRVGALHHELEERDGWRLEQKVETVISRLALPADRRLSYLSGGWRRRALLGKALVSEPHLLLLDEPTNHLDIEAIQWLEEYLQQAPSALLFVTHDRAFLSSLATRIVEIDRGRLTSWPGRYSEYLDKKSAALEQEARDLERLDKKLQKEEAWLRRGVKARRTRDEGRVRDLLELRAQRAAYRDAPGSVRLAIDDTEASGKLVFEAKGVWKTLGEVPVVRDYSQRIFRGDRIGIIGPNGSGKTTLLRLLVGELEPDQGTIKRGARLQVAYFDQQREQLDPNATVVDSVAEGNTTVLVHGQPRHVMGYLADFLFPRERAQSPVRSLSGGERNRLLLARLFAKPANVLVLDEPTNDLDLETLDLLEEAIAAFDGTVLLVSHDRVFLDHVVTSIVALEAGEQPAEYIGGWDDYLRQRRVGPGGRNSGLGVRGSGSGVRDSGVGRSGLDLGTQQRPTRAESSPAPRKLSYNEQRELASLPERIEAVEEEQRMLRSEMEAPDFYKAGAERIQTVMTRVEEAAREHDALLARWMELEERRSP
ncbi:MAG: ATP-binding cassette domain-containing protein [Vicinamibacterales bacterium]